MVPPKRQRSNQSVRHRCDSVGHSARGSKTGSRHSSSVLLCVSSVSYQFDSNVLESQTAAETQDESYRACRSTESSSLAAKVLRQKPHTSGCLWFFTGPLFHPEISILVPASDWQLIETSCVFKG
jgi:hypothetical protein